MKIVGYVVAVLTIMFGLRLIITAIQAALTQKILVRQGIRTKWQPASNTNEVWRIVFRDALMGILLLILGIMLIT